MIFALHKEILVKMGAYSDDKKRIGVLFSIIISFVLTSANISSFIFIWKNMLVDLEVTLFGILQVSAITGAISSLIIVLNNQNRVLNIEEQIKKIQGKSNLFLYFSDCFFLFHFVHEILQSAFLHLKIMILWSLH